MPDAMRSRALCYASAITRARAASAAPRYHLPFILFSCFMPLLFIALFTPPRSLFHAPRVATFYSARVYVMLRCYATMMSCYATFRAALMMLLLFLHEAQDAAMFFTYAVDYG